MKAHKSLQQKDVLRHGPSKIAMMVASEFWRAASGSKYRSDVQACYARARELMGILETIPFPVGVATDLQPFYRECTEKKLLREEHMSPTYVRQFSARVAEAFEHASAQLAGGMNNA